MIKKVTALALAGAFALVGFSSTSAFAYEAKSGDTMNKIAQQNNMSLQELAKLNPSIKDLNRIYVGQNIITNQNNTTQASTISTNVTTNTSVSAYEKDLLARLVRAEAESEPYAGKVAVATVVLNRVDNSSFPNSISAVINQSGQFSPVSNGEINKPADSESIRAVNEALTLNRSQGAGSLFFYNPKTSTSRWLDSRPTTITIGNHVFKK
ncbi:cell wall hydrolase [Priestia megaterium]|uniref:cell wall hydrolase n=1 Tax=Priestia megaterium TaxID=1404 RepID=UPI0028641FBC|nr:cell wall hydrolase [Priestia megaterium]MDR7207641.1 N-acetylmuramoyl-L-alanine amidase [Priestia megaterium]